MFKRIHDVLGTAGFIVAIVALIVALGGAAIAAVPGLNSTQKKEVKKIAKKFARQGPTGPQGPAGTNGKDGAPGANGKDGTNGANGKSVVAGTEIAGTNCAAGGSWFEVEGSGSKQYVCNGASSTGPLKAGETESGLWSFSAETRHPYATISFLREIETFNNIVWVGVGETPPASECPGSVEEPKAAPGILCIYAEQLLETEKSFPEYIFTDINNGLILEFEVEAGKEARGRGSWALTAPTS